MIRILIAAAFFCAPSLAFAQTGTASWYGAESGTRTASGQRFNPEGSTCAMRTHAWRWVTVTVLSTGRSERCYVNDYGPAAWTGKLIDVSHGIARRLGFAGAGIARVRVE
jgi:peptidoglycan lytic transglycosylase